MRLGFVGILCLSLCACQQEQSEKTINVAWLSSCPEINQAGQPSRYRNAECGQLEVAENPQNATSKKISLNVLRLPSINPVPQADPLFVIAGGPGQSAVELAPQIRGVFEDVRKNRDIVFVDQRGTGKSNPLSCDIDQKVISNLVGADKRQEAEKELNECLPQFKDYAQFYTTPYAVRDLEAVRVAIGYQKINLWGGSYGSRVVLEYLREFPNSARSGIIDGVAPVGIALPSNFGVDADAALANLNSICGRQPSCASAVGDIETQAKWVAEKLQQQAITLQILHPRTHMPTEITFDKEDFSGVIRSSLYDRDLSSVLPYAIHEAAQGRFELLGAQIFLTLDASKKNTLSMGMHFSVICAEDFPLAAKQGARPFLGVDIMQTYVRACNALNVAPMADAYYQPIKSDVPVLLLSGAGDPATPPRWAEAALVHLSKGKHLVAPGGHHLVSATGCAPQVINLFISKGSMDGVDTQCLESIQPLAIYFPPGISASASSASSMVSQGAVQ